MGVVANLRIRKCINSLLASTDSTSPQATQAVTRLKEFGAPAIPKLIEALDGNHVPSIITNLLESFVRNDTLPLYVKELSSASSQIVAGVTRILSSSPNYNPNNLIDYCSDHAISQTALTQILTHHKDRLDPQVVNNLLSNMDRENRTSILRLVEQASTEAMVPILLPWVENDDWIVRQCITRVFCQFPTPQAEGALVKCLEDGHKGIRQAALEGLASLNNPNHIGAICKLIRDADLTVQNKAIETVIQMNAPQTVPQLLELLQDESEYVRRGAVEVLNAVADTSAIKDLLDVLRDKDWWVRVRAADALGTIGGPAVVEAILDLIKDEDPFIRRSAVEILNTTKDERTFEALVAAISDEDWWVRERAIDALAGLGDARAVPVLLPLLEKDAETARVVIRALTTIGDQSALQSMLSMLQNPDRGVIKEALQGLGVLAQDADAAEVEQNVLGLCQHADASVGDLAGTTLKALVKRLGDQAGCAHLLNASTASGVMQSQVAQSQVAQSMIQSSALGSTSHQAAAAAHVPDIDLSAVDIDNLEPGEMLKNRYRVVRHVGKGAFGTALLVDDTAVHEQIVLKFLHPQLAATEQTIKRFIRELRYARRITHENVIRIYDFLEFGKSYAISMEYFESHSLAAYLQSSVQINDRMAFKLVQSICRGMHTAHQVEVIHRDLKPANILVNKQGVLKIVDFGLAAAVHDTDSRVTKTGAMVGTPAYMSPEQIKGEELDVRTDIYSLGVIMYEMFTGRLPYIGKDTVSVIYQHIQGNLIPPREVKPDILPSIELMITTAMAMDPQERYQSMEAVHAAAAKLELA